MLSWRKFLTGRSSGTALAVAFLLVTLCLSLWLGYQAVDAARSHRRTAEGVLADYAGIAVWEYSRSARENLDYLYRWVFDDIPWTLRRRPPTPDVMANDLSRVLRTQHCRCPGLRQRAWFFRVDLQDGSFLADPDTIPSVVLGRVSERIREHRKSDRDSPYGFVTAGAGAVLESASVVIFQISLDSSETDRLAYGLVADAPAFGELLGSWYRDVTLLPTVIAESQPGDSLLRVSVTGPDGVALFESPVAYPLTFSARDTLEAEYGSLVMQASIRPDASAGLIIGGLPRSRIPLLLGLVLLTLGLGAAALRQLRREQQLAALRDDFISGVSHEFRTPLTQIRVFAELLDEGKLRSEEERKRSVSVINREARRMTHLVENILQYARLSRMPGPNGALEEINLAETIDELAEAFAPQAASREARIETSVPPELVVRADRGGLHRILANLLDNALKYGAEGQTVRVSAVTTGNLVRVSVEDRGVGIPPRDRDRVWEPYRRLDRDVAGDVRGSGLGLAVVADLTAEHGGRAWVEDGSEGARFVVELPGAAAAGRPRIEG